MRVGSCARLQGGQLRVYKLGARVGSRARLEIASCRLIRFDGIPPFTTPPSTSQLAHALVQVSDAIFGDHCGLTRVFMGGAVCEARAPSKGNPCPNFVARLVGVIPLPHHCCLGEALNVLGS